MAAKGTVRYTGYATGGVVKPKGMKNKRKAKMRKAKEAVEHEKRVRQRKLEERQDAFSSEWDSYERS